MFIQNFRPGTADRLGAGAKRLQELNPKRCTARSAASVRMVPMWTVPATTRWRRRCRDSSAWWSTRTGRASWAALADAITGIYASYGVLGALFDRYRTGRGAVVEVSMLEAMAHFTVEPYAAYFALGHRAEVRGPAAAGTGPHPAHAGWRPDRHPPFLAGKILDRTAGRAGRAGAGHRPALQHPAAAHRELRCAGPGTGPPLPAGHGGRVGGTPGRATMCRSRPSTMSMPP